MSDITEDIAGDIMFARHAEIRETLPKVIEKFCQRGAVSPDKAISIDELGLPPRFKKLVEGCLGRLGIFVEVDGKYYLSEEQLKKVKEQLASRRSFKLGEDTIFDDLPLPLRRWLRHTASVPKGLLRYFVLKLLREKPMSGSEIMKEIETETDGRWKPSPGSVYPLLAWLQDDGYTKELPRKESGIKHYTLTEKGEKFFDEQTKFKERLQKKLEFLAPPFFSGFWFSSHTQKLREIREPDRRFIRALFNLRRTLEENLTDQALKEVGEFLNSTAEKIEEISKRLREGETKCLTI